MLFVAALLVTLLALLPAPPAEAGGPLLWANHNRVGQRMSICADSLAVRSSPGGPAFAYLYRPQTFTVQYAGEPEFGGEWVYGFAYGYVNAHGWIQNGWFCLEQ